MRPEGSLANLGFALKPSQSFLILRDCLWQNLDRDFAVELGVGSAIHFPHPVLTDLGGDLIVSYESIEHCRFYHPTQVN